MPRAKAAGPVVAVEQAPVEPEASVDEGTPIPEEKNASNQSGGSLDEQTGEPSLEEKFENLRGYVEELGAVVRGFEERISDLETLKDAEALLPGVFAPDGEFGEGKVFREEDDFPDYVDGVQRSFNGEHGDPAPWYRP